MSTTSTPPGLDRCPAGVHRVEVRFGRGQNDPNTIAVLDQARRHCGHLQQLRVARIYLIEAPLDRPDLDRISTELLADPVTQKPLIGAAPVPDDGASVEVHYRPGVMDPVAQSTRDAIIEMVHHLNADDIEVRTGLRYDLIGTDAPPQAIRRFAESALANTVIHHIHRSPFVPDHFAQGSPYMFNLVHVPIRQLDDRGLKKLSRSGHLFLSIEEMHAIQTYYQQIGREPTDTELETLAQTWSEHCVHKTLKSTIRYQEFPSNPQDQAGTRAPCAEPSSQAGLKKSKPSSVDWLDRPGHHLNSDGTLEIQNLLKSTIAAATRTLMSNKDLGDFCISVFADNAGIVRFDDKHGVCIKVETHNHPSALEPYGGSATGIGGVIRDVLGTGLCARPIANTDVFCVAWRPESDSMSDPSWTSDRKARDPSSDTRDDVQSKTGDLSIPKSVIPPKRILEQIVAGVRDYGNRMGIPTVNGAVWFHEGYLANPLVYCGCVGLIPLDKCFGSAKPQDRIIALGGRTGRDGIHGATFSSAELTGGHADEFSHAVQIGNAITQKKMMDVILQARDDQKGCLFHAITDCGAGGFSSAVGEMAKDVGAHVKLETAPLKYKGLNYTEIWISEAQERMVLAVPTQHVECLRQLCEAEDVEFCDLGQFGCTADSGAPELVLTYHGHEVAHMSMAFLHDGIPTPLRQAAWGDDGTSAHNATVTCHKKVGPKARHELSQDGTEPPDVAATLRMLLAHPNIASKHWIVRQYDHEVQGGSVIKPLTGPYQDGPSDAAVLRPKLDSERGIALGCGIQPGLSEKTTGNLADRGDSYWAALAAIDEAVRNVVCVGADPARIAILDNFCWPNCDDPHQLGSLVRAAEACYDGALAYRTPFVSGKDSLSNQFTTEDGQILTIPPTLLITALGIVPDVMRCQTMDAKAPSNALLAVGPTTTPLGGSHYMAITGDVSGDLSVPHTDLNIAPRTAATVGQLIRQGLVRAAHDCSDGGLLVAAAEMAFAGRIGLELNLADVPGIASAKVITKCFAETPGRYLLEVEPAHLRATENILKHADIPSGRIGTFANHDRLIVTDTDLDESLEDLRNIWLAPLDW